MGTWPTSNSCIKIHTIQNHQWRWTISTSSALILARETVGLIAREWPKWPGQEQELYWWQLLRIRRTMMAILPPPQNNNNSSSRREDRRTGLVVGQRSPSTRSSSPRGRPTLLPITINLLPLRRTEGGQTHRPWRTAITTQLLDLLLLGGHRWGWRRQDRWWRTRSRAC